MKVKERKKEKREMTHDLLIRGFDDEIHSQLGELAKEKGVFINSIVKDAVDRWLQQRQSDIPKKHYLLIYSDNNDDSMLGLLKSMDRLAKEGDTLVSVVSGHSISQLADMTSCESKGSTKCI